MLFLPLCSQPSPIPMLRLSWSQQGFGWQSFVRHFVNLCVIDLILNTKGTKVSTKVHKGLFQQPQYLLTIMIQLNRGYFLPPALLRRSGYAKAKGEIPQSGRGGSRRSKEIKKRYP
jgi:hypothetical protein